MEDAAQTGGSLRAGASSENQLHWDILSGELQFKLWFCYDLMNFMIFSILC